MAYCHVATCHGLLVLAMRTGLPIARARRRVNALPLADPRLPGHMTASPLGFRHLPGVALSPEKASGPAHPDVRDLRPGDRGRSFPLRRWSRAGMRSSQMGSGRIVDGLAGVGSEVPVARTL